MPNHCANRLTIYGNKLDRDQFISNHLTLKANDNKHEILEKPNLDLNTIIKTGKCNTLERFWGTKWGCYDTDQVQHDDEKTVLEFLTAWCPYNNDIHNKMWELFPNLYFELLFCESGCEFYGYYKLGKTTNGDIVAYTGKALSTRHPECPILDGETSEYTGCYCNEDNNLHGHARLLYPELRRDYQMLYDKSY